MGEFESALGPVERGSASAHIAGLSAEFPLSIEHMGIGIALIGPDGHTLLVNKALCDIVGRGRAELLALDLRSLTHPQDGARDLEMAARATAGNVDNWKVEKRLLRGDGSTIWVFQEVTVVRDDAGDVVHFVGQVIDIDARKRAEEELAESQARYRDLFESMPVGLVEIDLQGTVLASNPAAGHIAGRVVEVGSNSWSVTHPADIHRVGLEAQKLIRTGGNFRLEYRIVQPDGGVRWVRNDVHPKVAANGRLVSLTGSWIDVTELREAEDELRRQARRDPLTGLANRTLLQEHCEHELSRRRAPTITVLFVDLDGFKAVNDRLGHAVGDDVLRLVAGRIVDALRAEDLVARIGGDEFVAICLDVDDDVVAELAARLISVVAEPVPVLGGAELAKVGASVGVARKHKRESIGETIRRADNGVYAAKRAGGGTFILADDPA